MHSLVRLVAAIAMVGSAFAASAPGASADQGAWSEARGNGPGAAASCPSQANPRTPGALAHWEWRCVGKHSMRLTGYVQDTRRDGKDACIMINAGHGKKVIARTSGVNTRAAIDPPVQVGHRNVATYLVHC